MKKILLTIPVIVLCLLLAACGGGKKSASSLAQKWCDLNGKVTKAADGAEKEAAKAALNKWENEMEAKYKGDEAFMKEVEKETEKCEGASEGRK
jgi:ABC-type glycerol-3-phosphate transport system substrate-binding protein